MKKCILFLALAAGVLGSCKEEGLTPVPETGYIKATIDGVERIYSTLPPNADDYNNIKPGAINIHFNKNSNTREYWSLSIAHAYVTRDINTLPLPFTITGPSFDFTGQSPEAHLMIVDPDGAPYGKMIANGSSFHHPIRVTIISVKDNVVRGTFEGQGNNKFEHGEFAARLPLQDW